MPIPVSAGNGASFTPAPQGVHQGVCVDVVDMGNLEVVWQGTKKIQHKIRIVWQIEELMDDGKPFIVQKRYTASLHEKAQLRKDLESWRGRAFTEDELKSFDLERLLGVNALLNVMRVDRDGKTYANVTAVMPIKKGMPAMTVTNYTRTIDRSETSGNQPPAHDDGPGLTDDGPGLTDDDIPF